MAHALLGTSFTPAWTERWTATRARTTNTGQPATAQGGTAGTVRNTARRRGRYGLSGQAPGPIHWAHAPSQGVGTDRWGRAEFAGISQRWRAPAASLAGCMVSLSTIYCIPFFILMMCAPQQKWLQDLIKTPWFIVPIAVIYLVLLLQSWQPDTLSLMMPGSIEEGVASGKPQFFPQLEGISKLFSRSMTAASLWVHILSINLFTARHVVLDGLEHSVPTRHSILLSSLVGPIGLLSHFLTKGVVLRWRKEQGGTSPAGA